MTISLPLCGRTFARPHISHVHLAERVGYQLATRPWLRRGLACWAATHFLMIWALTAAPRAAAATMNAALNWTGVTDSAGVPIGAYFLSTVDTLEAVTDGGPDVSLWDPGTWIQWGAHAVTTGITHDAIATWLQAEASIYIFMLTAALWLLRFSMSSTWLYWLATWFRPIFEVLHRFLTDHHFYAICLVLGIAVGAYHVVVRGHHGRGAGIILTAFAIMIVGMYLLRDPIGELYSDDGLLNQARGLGFSTAQAALNNGPITAGGSATQLSRLTGLLVDALVRAPLQIWNFGTTVDNIGSCGSAWSHAILTGVRDAPAHAMQGCGAPQALAYARSIDGSIFALGLGFIVLGLLFALFVSYVSYSYAMVIGAAFLNAILALFAAGPAMIHGVPRAKARRRLKEFFRHACYVFVYVLYISFAAVVILKTVRPGGYASQVGMNSPVAKLFLVAMVSAVATGIFRWLKKELGDQTRQDLTHTITDTYHHARDGFDRGRHTVDRGRELTNKARDRFGNTGDDAGADGESDGALTAKPVKGRPPGGKPATRQPNSIRPPHQASKPAHPHPTKPPGATRAGAKSAGAKSAGAKSAGVEVATAGTEAAAAGAEAGAAILAPEVAVPVAVAALVAHHHKQHRQQTNQRTAQPNNGDTSDQPTNGRRDRGTARQPSPTQGRTVAAQPDSSTAWQQQTPERSSDQQAPPPTPGRH